MSERQWIPHRKETWPTRYGILKKDVTMGWYQGYWKDGEPVMKDEFVSAGTKVKIVMVSRFGDIGITNKLDTDTSYGTRVEFDELRDYSNE